MKENFCKIIELEEYQVLITKSYKPDKEYDGAPYDLIVMTHHDGIEMKVTGCYKEEKLRDENFDNYSVEKAQNLVDRITKAIT